MINFFTKVVGLCFGITIIGGGGFVMAQSRNDLSLKDKNKTSNLMELYARQAHESLLIQKAPTSAVRNAESAEQEVVLEENFSRITGGTEAEPGNEIGSYTVDGNSLWPDDMTNNPDWWGIGTYAIDGAVGLCYPGVGGVVCSGPADMYGNLHVSLRAKAREGNNEGANCLLIFSIVKGDIYNPEIAVEGYKIVNLKVEDGWQDINLTFRNPNRNSDSRLQINGMTYCKAGFVIDDIKITRDYDFCLPPTEMACSDFTNDGFTITWNQGAENNSYLFSLIQEKKLSDVFDATEDFEGSLPQYWSTTGKIVAEGGADNSKALRLDNAQELELAFGGGRLAKLDCFIHCGQFDENSTATVKVIGIIGTEEIELGNINVTRLAADGEILGLRSLIYDYIYQLEKIKFVADGFGKNEYCLFDNVAYLASLACERTQLKEDEPVSENKIVLTGLDPENEYYVGVKGVKKEDFISDFLGYFYVPGMPTPEALDATNIEKRGAYTANWKPSAKAQSYTVCNYQITTVKEDQENYVVLRDEFTKANDAVQESLDQPYYDDWTDCKGWHVSEIPEKDRAIADAGYIGALYMPIYAPAVSLDNCDGKFTVRFKVKAYGYEKIYVYSNDQVKCFDFGEVNPDGDPYEFEEHEVEMEFDNGTEMQSIVIAASDYSFFLDWFEITQNVKAGDRIIRFADVAQVEGHNTCEYRFTGLENDKDIKYAYNVMANGKYMDQSFSSNTSNLIFVDLNQNTNGVETHEYEGIRVQPVDGGIELVLSKAAEVSVYTISGTLVSTTHRNEGTSYINMPEGIYVVRI